MESVLQFDPANLCVWYQPRPPDDDADDVLGAVTAAALAGEHRTATGLVTGIPDDRLRVRAGNLVSTVWHEQRHFADVLLTNFGQSVHRRYTSLLVNVGEVLASARTGGAIGLPLTIYDRPNRLRLSPLSSHPTLRQIAVDMRSRDRMVAEDARHQALPSGGDISVGGLAQLEALGYLSQGALLQESFGPDLAAAVQRDMPNRQRLRHEYEWIMLLGARLGFGTQGRDSLTVLVTPLAALLYGALMIRRWGQGQAEVEGGHSAAAVARIDPLLNHLRGTGALRDATSALDAWQAVDAACEHLFGRSATAELLEDLRLEAEFCARIANERGSDSVVFRFMAGVHGARRRLAALFLRSPEVVVDPLRYAELRDRIFPVPVRVDLGGVDEVPSGSTPLWIGAGRAGAPEWAWASAPVETVRTSDRIHVVADPDAWTEAVRDWIPLTKLLLNGNRQVTAIGPEMQHAELILGSVEITSYADPIAGRPEVATGSAGFWWHRPEWSGGVCDGCGAGLARGEGSYLTGTLMRAFPDALQWMFRRIGLDRTRRDWTGWLLCARCRTECGVPPDAGPAGGEI